MISSIPPILNEIWPKLVEHIFLSKSALLIAIGIAIPLSVILNRSARFRAPILGLIHIFQTIPSLALLALLIPLIGIGTLPALIVLVLYSLLPLVKNTFTGLQEVPEESIEAARALGFTPWQRFYLVEMPLAFPMIMAGIRTAASMAIGIATIATFIGAGGLGDLIAQGLSLNSTQLILMGAIPTTLLALLVDAFLAKLEQSIQPQKQPKKRKNKGFWTIAVVMILILITPGLLRKTLRGSQETITISCKNYTEQFILAEIMAQLIESETNLKVVRKFNLGTTLIIHEALLRGDVDLYPEYTGTAYLVVLKEQQIQKQKNLYQEVKNTYQEKYDLEWLAPFGFNNVQRLAVHRAFAQDHQISCLSDLKAFPNLVLAAPAEFIKRPDAFPKLKKVYGLSFQKIHLMIPDLAYLAIAANKVDIICSFSTDAKIQQYNLVSLMDDKNSNPSYLAAPVIRGAILETHPEIRSVLDRLKGKISNETMQRLNAEVDLNKRLPSEIARDFLRTLL